MPRRSSTASTLHARVAHYIVYDLDTRFEALGLSLVEWVGRFEDHEDRWLRWADLRGQLVLTGAERAEHEHERAQRLAARLRELGVDPDDA